MTRQDNSGLIGDYKLQAKRLREQLGVAGLDISHSRALELVAQQHGMRDWNTLRAHAVKAGAERPLAVGDRVAGRYLGNPFSGYVHALRHADGSKYRRISVKFDAPLDVVKFDSFSSWRSQVSAVIDETGQSLYRITGGEPQLVVAREAA